MAMMSVVQAWDGMRRQQAIAFEHLFLTEYATVVAIAQQVLRDVHEAEDVAQEVFCSFYRQHPPDATYARAWLRRAAAHSALNVLRGRRRRVRREETDAMDRERLSSVTLDLQDPQNAAVRAELQREVRQALARLPQKRAEILALRYSGLSYAEVAEALGVGVGQVGTLLRRAERAFQKELGHETSR